MAMPFAMPMTGQGGIVEEKNYTEYYPSWEPPVSCLRATRKWYFPHSGPPQHLVAAYIFDLHLNLLCLELLLETLIQERENRLIKNAYFKYSSASLESLDYVSRQTCYTCVRGGSEDRNFQVALK